MNRMKTREDYSRRIARIIDYIYDHLDEDLTTEKLAEVACFSPYHWHRIYRSVTGETAAEAIRRLRLHRAAGDLANSDLAIRAVAARAAYGSVAAFSRAFHAKFGMPPATYRSNGLFPQAPKPHQYNGAAFMYDVEVKSVPALRLAAVKHRGDYLTIGKAFEKLAVHAGPKGWFANGARLIGVYHDDPAEVPEADLRADAGIVLAPDISIAGDEMASELVVPAGRAAVLRFKGPYAEMEGAYKWLFGIWLPQSGEEVADRPSYEEYLNDPREVVPSELLTDIYLPLK